MNIQGALSEGSRAGERGPRIKDRQREGRGNMETGFEIRGRRSPVKISDLSVSDRSSIRPSTECYPPSASAFPNQSLIITPSIYIFI